MAMMRPHPDLRPLQTGEHGGASELGSLHPGTMSGDILAVMPGEVN